MPQPSHHASLKVALSLLALLAVHSHPLPHVGPATLQRMLSFLEPLTSGQLVWEASAQTCL